MASLHNPLRIILLIPIALLLLYGLVHYRFVSKRILASHKHALGVEMRSKLNGPRISMIYVLGTVLAYLVLGIGLGLLAFGVMIVVGAGGYFAMLSEYGGVLSHVPGWLSVAGLSAFYLTVFLMWGVMHHVFVTFPLMRHMAVTLSLRNVGGLSQISQRARDEFAEAEGFAEALDLGAAI